MLGGKNIRFTSVRLSTRELAEQLSINGAIFSLDCETDDQAFLPTPQIAHWSHSSYYGDGIYTKYV